MMKGGIDQLYLPPSRPHFLGFFSIDTCIKILFVTKSLIIILEIICIISFCRFIKTLLGSAYKLTLMDAMQATVSRPTMVALGNELNSNDEGCLYVGYCPFVGVWGAACII